MEEDTFEVNEPPMQYGALDLSKRYTYSDYLKFQFEERVELIRGFIHKMSPAPRIRHQRISAKLFLIIGNLFQHKSCEVFYAPFDVRLPIPTEKKEYTVVQPDLGIICDSSILEEMSIKGVPDLLVEILSTNKKHDTKTKFELYEEAGVPEYWIVNPEDETIIIYSLQNKKYVGSRMYSDELIVESPAFSQIQFEAQEIFGS